MAKFPDGVMISGRYDTSLDCPVCGAQLELAARVKVYPPTTTHVATEGRDKIITANIPYEIVGFSISHSCDYKKPEKS